MIRYDWTKAEIKSLYELPFPELIFRAQLVHREHFPEWKIQKSTLLSIKTGGCAEDCGYCSQSAHHSTGLERHKLLDKEKVIAKAQEAKDSGSTRFCMGAAWREVRDGGDFDSILEMVSEVSAMGLEVCCTLGMLTAEQARRLKEAGCFAYNHNLDTSPEYYGNVITTRTYEDRLRTLERVRAEGMTLCCGGILGLGESIDDRVGLLEQLARQNPHPESVPINMLVKVEGTPLSQAEEVDPLDLVRIIAIARILMPKSFVRLSAGRTAMSDETQALAFLAGANSIFAGDKLLTTPNPDEDSDRDLISRLGMQFYSSTDIQAINDCR